MLTLELPGGSQFVSDGHALGSDLEVRLGSPGSGSFDLEIGVGHNRFVPVEGDLSGDQTIDLDHLGACISGCHTTGARGAGFRLAGLKLHPGSDAPRREPHPGRSSRASYRLVPG